MQWTLEAEAAIKKVPFFVRKKVRARVETEAVKDGRTIIDMAAVKITQKRYLSGMADEIKGYQLDTCFGPSGCPHRALASDDLVRRLEQVLQAADLLSLLKKRVGADLKFHHEFRVTVAECPNACSQPQIKDVGIIGAVVPDITDAPCTHCGACAEVCPDDAITFADETVTIDRRQCMRCGKCILACPAGTLRQKAKGYRILLGGKLGRHPTLAKELPGIFDAPGVVQILEACLRFYKEKSIRGERFAAILTDAACAEMAEL